MKVYSVKPGDNYVLVSDGRHLTHDEGIAWGDSGPAAIRLSRLLLEDVYGLLAPQLRQTQVFKWDIIKTWARDAVHAITEQDIRNFIEEKEKTMRENAPMIARQAREQPMYVTDRPAPGQEWSNNPDIKVNKNGQGQN
jgi:hypothetical protein